MQYQQLNDQNSQVRTDGIQQTNDAGVISWVPNDPNNRDWAAYQVWLAAGNTPTPAS